jgi:lipoate synthase
MKPEWLRRKLPDPEALAKMRSLLQRHGLHTVCQGALFR